MEGMHLFYDQGCWRKNLITSCTSCIIEKKVYKTYVNTFSPCFLPSLSINLFCLQRGVIRALRVLIDLDCTEQPQLASSHLLGGIWGILRVSVICQDDTETLEIFQSQKLASSL